MLPRTPDAPAAIPGSRGHSPPPRSSSDRPARTSLARDLFVLLRPGQWPKNLVVLLALLDPALMDWRAAGRLGVAVGAFVIAASAVYVLNDIADRERDRASRTKRHRPIAAGRVTPRTAALLGVLLLGVLAVIVGDALTTWWPLLVYLPLNLAYSFGLKHVPLVDLFVVAAGFVLRLVQGYTTVGARPPGWLVLCVLSVCLLLVLGKRRHELLAGEAAHRPSLAGYNQHLVDALLVLTAAATLVTYLAYAATVSATGLLTVPCALFALFRYLQVVFVDSGGGNPVSVLLRDRVLLVNAALWLLLLEGSQLHG
ncbi:UbiA prenyltransferase family protein [Micromonospora sp. Llam0]|uniref:UbiA prenyltransferase family protein n=1 Tax=Micromonospora sp. Llam0 TaxID=2485143 RepID=UPI000F46CC6C|nr:UbiA prenyltransferase family protein [Micromonospora sp. Llam0]